MPYKYELTYRQGKDEKNPADFSSQHPVSEFSTTNIAEDYINYVCYNAVPNAMTLEEVQMETQRDSSFG